MPVPIPRSCEELLRAMVRFDTVNGNISGRPDAERELSCHMEGQARAMGFETSRLPVGDAGFNLLVTCRYGGDRPWLLFESHLDTVSVSDMTIDPFAGEVRDGRIYGRGTCDTKGSGAAMLWALRRYAESERRPNNIAIAYTLDEEIGKSGIRSLVGQVGSMGFRPAGAVVGEPTELRPVVAHNGVVRWAIRTKGVAAHSADPSKGRSAIRMMMAVMGALEGRYIPGLTASHPMTGKAQCSINMIRGGAQINIIPESCEIRVDRRVVPGEDPGEATPAVVRLLDELRRDDPHLAVEVEALMIDGPLDPAGGWDFIGRVRGTLEELGLASEPCGAAYATDASDFAQAGIPAVVLGPGSIAQAHTCDEWLSLDQLRLAVDVYLGLMRSTWEGQG